MVLFLIIEPFFYDLRIFKVNEVYHINTTTSHQTCTKPGNPGICFPGTLHEMSSIRHIFAGFFFLIITDLDIALFSVNHLSKCTEKGMNLIKMINNTKLDKLYSIQILLKCLQQAHFIGGHVIPRHVFFCAALYSALLKTRTLRA